MPICRCPNIRLPLRLRSQSDFGKVRADCSGPADSEFCTERECGRNSLKRNSDVVRLAVLLAAASLLATLLGCKSQVSGDVMATVDGRKIFRSDVDKYYDNQVASAQQPPVGEQATILRLNILRQMIDDEMVMRRAEKLGLLATDEEVDRKMNQTQ